MFSKLKQHWKVNNKDLFFILCTFAVTGTLTAWISKKITIWLEVERLSFLWWALKIIVLFFGYQIIILITGFCFGKFRFFWNYEKKILRRMGIKTAPRAMNNRQAMNIKQKEINAHFTAARKKEKEHSKISNPFSTTEKLNNKKPINIAIFASGTGSNAQNIIDYFRTSKTLPESEAIKVALIVCNNPSAPVLQIAQKEKISSLLIQKNKFYIDGYLDELKKYEIDFIVLAGFMWKIPTELIRHYRNKIINIHPALLPKYGGKNMYGNFVHEAVVNEGEKESGITIHYVDELYDHGKIIFQARCAVEENETSESLAKKIHLLEYANYPKVIEQIVHSSK